MRCIHQVIAINPRKSSHSKLLWRCTKPIKLTMSELIKCHPRISNLVVERTERFVATPSTNQERNASLTETSDNQNDPASYE